MARLIINGKEIEAAEGMTLLEAARQTGADIPTLCHLKETGALTTCMICVVKENATGRLLPSCAAKAVDGMDIDTDCKKVHAARREVLRMLLAEHVGDCEAPCSRTCPAGLRIPQMLRHIDRGETEAAARLAKRDLIFPATLGHVCTAPCERVCRRAQYDTPVAIRSSHREVAMQFLDVRTAREKQATGKSVAVAGAGLAGLSAAWICAQNGHACRIYERQNRACEALRISAGDKLPATALDAEIESVRALGVEFAFGVEVEKQLSVEELLDKNDVVIVACDLSCPSNNRVFYAKEERLHVRAVGSGKKAAREANAFLAGNKSGSPSEAFDSNIGKLRTEEHAAYAVERVREKDYVREAARCLHCDCTKPASCKLRQYADEYGIASHLVRNMERPPVAPIQTAGDVLFEAGKCIKCGICVEITRAAGLDAGMAFAGRGLDSHVMAPFGEALTKGLGKVADRCVEACPTAALSFRNREEIS